MTKAPYRDLDDYIAAMEEQHNYIAAMEAMAEQRKRKAQAVRNVLMMATGIIGIIIAIIAVWG
jgi:hypothetical protein